LPISPTGCWREFLSAFGFASPKHFWIGPYIYMSPFSVHIMLGLNLFARVILSGSADKLPDFAVKLRCAHRTAFRVLKFGMSAARFVRAKVYSI
jgi:hypothetical protein